MLVSSRGRAVSDARAVGKVMQEARALESSRRLVAP